MKQTDMVLAYMKEHGSISSMEAFNDLGVTRLSAVVFDLRSMGHKIDTDMETSANRWEKKVSYARYRLNKEEEHAG